MRTAVPLLELTARRSLVLELAMPPRHVVAAAIVPAEDPLSVDELAYLGDVLNPPHLSQASPAATASTGAEGYPPGGRIPTPDRIERPFDARRRSCVRFALRELHDRHSTSRAPEGEPPSCISRR